MEYEIDVDEIMDLADVERLSDQELVKLAQENGVDLRAYIV